ncbi:MAG: copper amine oxidase N-terminal domain-containing protein [Armatimonadota bacterium]
MKKLTALVVLALMSALFLVTTAQALPATDQVSRLGAYELAEIINDPVMQRQNMTIVRAAIHAIEQIATVESVSVLVDNIGYPLSAKPLPLGSEPIPDPVIICGSHNAAEGAILIAGYPVAQALVRMGNICIPEVLWKLGSTDSLHEVDACLCVLIDLRGKADAGDMIEDTLASQTDAKTQRRLRQALKMLPSIVPSEGAYSSRTNARLDISASNLAEGRKQLIDTMKVQIPPTVAVDNLVTVGRTVSVDGVTLTSAKELGELLGLEVKQEDGGITLISTTRTLAMEVGSSTALADGKSLSLPVAVTSCDKDVLVPLRVVADYFGAKTKWDASARIAWVSTGKQSS